MDEESILPRWSESCLFSDEDDKARMVAGFVVVSLREEAIASVPCLALRPPRRIETALWFVLKIADAASNLPHDRR